MIKAIAAGNNEKSDQIILLTDSSFVIVITVSPVTASVPEMNPDKPKNNATSEPEIAVPNFCDMVPEENIKPVEDVPFFSVA